MIRVPSNGCLPALTKSRSTSDLRAVCNASVMSESTTMLAATATIVSASSAIADSKDACALIGAVASMIGAASTLVASLDVRASHEIVEIVERRGDFDPGVRIDGMPALEARERRRLDVQIIADVDERVSIGNCVWDAPGPSGVYVNGLNETEYLRMQCTNVLDLTVVGQGSFRTTPLQGTFASGGNNANADAA